MWKPIAGYEGLYEINNVGEVRRLKGFWCKTNRAKTPLVGANGYTRIALFSRDDRRPCKKLVHRLVYEAFVGAIPPGMTVNHKNGVKSDNRVDNLELATMREQMLHAYSTGLQPVARGESRKNVAKLTEDKVRSIRTMYASGRYTYASIASQYGVSAGCVLTVVKKLRWSHVP